MSRQHIPYPADFQTDYHSDLQAQRVERAMKLIDPGDVIAILECRLAGLASPQEHPLFKMVAWHLAKCLTPLDGAAFFDTFRRLVLAAIDTALDDALETLEG